ncbi:NAD-dependent epimerase/dehydratase family protein [Hymenobacter sp. UV11]|uniref:NAD-dependent epimerase/dehydratase family protein n=1 Tax=Hymenobacter sp. UV11 TaxID=1849735 RepID=UPI00105F7196|nr:NAD-dependent epimerase/dehydratase family protein [Hymenobacter sp. UV11]TDN36698.1 dihydroflavonol 4-reductase [Hymenobacter sp. UV11]TFZ66200.1 NAD-dependent epimerase/dehydratase family protein [Hymenobacter sp. UV11]
MLPPPPLPRVLVTGANGFLGRHLVAELLRRGYPVRALVRPGSAAPAALPPLQSLPIEVCEVDLTRVVRKGEMADTIGGCGAIIHTAALAQVNPARSRAVRAANLGGTEQALCLAHQGGVGRFVYVGTANVFGFGSKQRPGDETRPYAGRRYGLDYMDSKRAATDRVLAAVARAQLPAVLVHPTFMLGPGDARPTSGALLLELLAGRLPGYPLGGKNYVQVRDVAVATVNALTMGRVGESYILGNENLSYKEAFVLMAEIMGVGPPRWPVLPVLANFYGAACDLQARLTGRLAQVNSAMTSVANDGHYFTAQKARTELALPQTSIQQAVADAFAWFKTHGYVR